MQFLVGPAEIISALPAMKGDFVWSCFRRGALYWEGLVPSIESSQVFKSTHFVLAVLEQQ